VYVRLDEMYHSEVRQQISGHGVTVTLVRDGIEAAHHPQLEQR
jgi:predicted GNAT family acetyltransferase